MCCHSTAAAPGGTRFVLLIQGCPHNLGLSLQKCFADPAAPQSGCCSPGCRSQRVPVLPAPGEVLPGSGTFCMAFGDN